MNHECIVFDNYGKVNKCLDKLKWFIIVQGHEDSEYSILLQNEG